MEYLKTLINESCPNGVPYKELGEIATISRGGNLQKKDFRPEGVPCIHYGQIYTRYGLFANQTFTFISKECAKKQKLAYPNDIVMAVTSENIEDVCKCVAWLGDEAVAVSGHAAIIHHNQNAKYLAYYFHTQMFAAQKRKLVHGTKVMEVTPDTLNAVKIPLPPLPIQSEIVKILDNFTELTARKKQYEYYRDKLLTFDVLGGASDCVWRTVGEVAGISRGKVISKDFIHDNPGIYPVYSSQTQDNGELGKISSFDYSGEYLTWTTDGANAGSIFYRIGKFSITNVCGLLTPYVDVIHTRFLFHVLAITAKLYVNAGMGNPKLMSNVMANIKIPVPPLNVQKDIATILDRFDALCNDLTSGLPAEIAARQKQYEYYRYKLLTFKEASV